MTKESSPDNGFRDAIKDDESLAIFLRKSKQLQDLFCSAMVDGIDYTFNFEIRGNKHELLHCQIRTVDMERPSGVEKRVARNILAKKP